MTTADVAALLRDDILSNHFPPGDRLVELQLAARYDAGRATVRAALVELRAEGLVDIAANRGATVRRVSLQEAIEIAEARMVLEALLARRAAERGDDDERAELERLLESMATAVDDDDQRAYSARNLDFHRHIHAMSGHGVGSDLVSTLRNRAAHHQYRLAVMPGRAAESLEQHRAIAVAIQNGDGTGAQQAMQDHLASVVDVLRQWSDVGVEVG